MILEIFSHLRNHRITMIIFYFFSEAVSSLASLNIRGFSPKRKYFSVSINILKILVGKRKQRARRELAAIPYVLGGNVKHKHCLYGFGLNQVLCRHISS